MLARSEGIKSVAYIPLLLGVWLVTLGGCLDTGQTPKPGSPCEEQSHCECVSCPYSNLLLCDNNTCHRICNVDSECDENEYCQGGLCIAPDIPCTNKSACPLDTPCTTYACINNFCQASTKAQGAICMPESECIVNASCDAEGQCIGEIQECALPDSSCQDVDNETYVVYYEVGQERDPETCVCNILEKTAVCTNCNAGVEERQFCIDCMTASCDDPAGDCQSNCACNPASGECECLPEDSSETNRIACYLSTDADEMLGVCISGTCAQCFSQDDCAGDEICESNNCVTPVECSGPTDCQDDGLFCNGDEYCDESTNYCAHSGTSCDSQLMCDEEFDACVECMEDGDCPRETSFCRPDTKTCVQCWPNDTPCNDLTPDDCHQAQCADGICVQDHSVQSSAPSALISCKQIEPCDENADCSTLGDDDDDDDDDDSSGTGGQIPTSEHEQTCLDAPGGFCIPGNGLPGYCAMDESGTCVECADDDHCAGDLICDECGVCGGPGIAAGCATCAEARAIPAGQCDCNGAIIDECGICGGNGIAEGECDCEGNVLDECGECGGSGIAEGECDCEGNILDECGECGGPCVDLLPNDCKTSTCQDNICTIAFGSAGPGSACAPYQYCTSDDDCSSGICSNSPTLLQHFGFNEEHPVDFSPYTNENYFTESSGHICIGVDETSATGFCWPTELHGGDYFPMCLQVQCTADSNCSALSETPYCDTEGDTPSFDCVECTEESHCTAPEASKCHNNACVECGEDNDCVGNADGPICDSAYGVIGVTYSCVACTQDSHCIANEKRPSCNSDEMVCVNCRNSSECDEAGLPANCCPNGQCKNICGTGGGAIP